MVWNKVLYYQAFVIPPRFFFYVGTKLVLQRNMSPTVRKPTIWILTRSDTNQAVQQLEMARGLKFWI